MTGVEIFLIIFGILVFIGIIIVIALLATGYFVSENIDKTLAGSFSIRSDADKTKYITTTSAINSKTPASGDQLAVSDPKNITCQYVRWQLQNGLMPLGETGLIAQAPPTSGTQPISGTPVTVASNNGATDYNQWIFNKAGGLFCLSKYPDFCMVNDNNLVTLQNKQANINFLWFPEPALQTPTCAAPNVF